MNSLTPKKNCVIPTFPLHDDSSSSGGTVDVKDDGLNVHVLPHCTLLPGGRCVTNSSLIPFGRFVGGLELDRTKVSGDAEPAAPRRPRPTLADVVEFPWLAHYLKPSGHFKSQSELDADRAGDAPLNLSELAWDDVWAQLLARREEWGVGAAIEDFSNFIPLLRGGEWTVKKKKRMRRSE